jgi:ribosome-associated toxin RatA of RatAB toxin-antitoxin module
MPTIESSITIHNNINKVFETSQDYNIRLQWDPFLKEIRYLHQSPDGINTEVWVRAKNYLTMTVIYISYKYPETVAMKMTQGPWIFKKFSGSWRFQKINETTTKVIFRYNFICVFTLIDKMMEYIFKRDIDKRLTGLKKFLEDTP